MTSPLPLTVMLVAAEASGDDRGAGLMRALKARLADKVRFVGVGGPRMAAEGLDSPFDITELSVLGLLEGVMAYGKVIRRADETAAIAAREKPDIAVLIDSWGFTLRVAQRLGLADPTLSLVKYVGPQIWASRPGRARVAAGAYDHLLTIHAFDAPAFEAAGLPTTFVGNSALALDFAAADPAGLRAGLGAAAGDSILLVLPGSRPAEIARVLPPFLEAARRLKAQRPNLHVLVAAAATVADRVREQVGAEFAVIEGQADKLSAMKAATVALACSGTVTTELALAGCPMVVGYRIGAVSYAILKRLVSTRWITLMNIAAQAGVVPELIQADCTPEALAREAGRFLDDRDLREDQIAAQAAALETMGRDLSSDPDAAAAEAVLAVIRRASPRPG